ncbi:LPS export ABC transporter permease LptF [Rhizobium sp. SSA_523]|uniref:LPS export ABC transporter permease LptF n=1 Tax=Rhizobium sp. SSA_523 TaxID=2952477 RepID=UPI002090AE0B|nr:LPS export ABC transporter permease LptF [Rhizobium sp. SSA_523]MCO5730759.1 LPS export ABC transporter permease LptF [Rhizobium sp. SSA_523]WKC24417.1 LPS export ABC transporter permease LptF [Rhizobium sp. SSA_523]
MKILEAYIFRRAFQMFLVTLLPVLTIIWTIQVLGRINLVTDTGQSIGSFATLATFILPTIIPVVLPFAVVIGVTQTLNAMNNDSELAVIDAAGASRLTIYRPMLLLAVLMAAFSFLVTNFVEPASRVKAREMVAEAYADLLSSVIEEKTFRSVEDGLYVQISERHSGRILTGIFLVDYRDPNWDLIYYAREGSIAEDGKTLTMRDGEVHRKSPDGRISIVKFLSYAFDLSSMTESTGEAPVYSSDRSLAFLLNPDPTDKTFLFSPGSFRSELHRRLSDWMLPIVFTLISLVIIGGARSSRRARLHPMVAALALSFALKWLTFYITNMSKNSVSAVPLIYAVPVGVALLAIVMLATNRQLTLPRVVSGVTATWLERAKARLLRAPGAAGKGGGA